MLTLETMAEIQEDGTLSARASLGRAYPGNSVVDMRGEER